MKIKAIIFDVDDTLINTFDPICKKFKKVSEILKIKEISKEELKKNWGKTTERLTSSLWPNLKHEKFREVYDKFGYDEPYPLFEGSLDVLNFVKEKDILMAILTSRKLKTLIIRSKQVGLSLDYFKFIQTQDDTDIHKPDPKVFEPILKKFNDNGIKNEEILYVGDNMFDAKASLGNNLNFVAVLTGTTTKEEFLEEGIDEKNLIISIKDFKEWFLKNFESF